MAAVSRYYYQGFGALFGGIYHPGMADVCKAEVVSLWVDDNSSRNKHIYSAQV